MDGNWRTRRSEPLIPSGRGEIRQSNGRADMGFMIDPTRQPKPKLNRKARRKQAAIKRARMGRA